MPEPSLCLCATVWSLRQYPSEEKEWSWPRKFSAIEEAGFDGLMSPPLEELKERGDLVYWAITSLGVGHDPRPFFEQATELGAAGATVQPCDVDTPLEECVCYRAGSSRGLERDLRIECSRGSFGIRSRFVRFLSIFLAEKHLPHNLVRSKM